MFYHVVPSVFASLAPIIGKIEVKFDKNVILANWSREGIDVLPMFERLMFRHFVTNDGKYGNYGILLMKK